MIALLLAVSSLAAKPINLAAWQSVTVDYTMKTTGTSSCQTTFRGTGGNPVVQKDFVTFAGTWEIVSDTCQGRTVFAPADKVAHHTLRLDKTGKAIDEWVVHAKAADNQRFTSDIQARGQYWINELAAVPSTTGVFAWKSTETQGIFPLSVTIDHDLTVTLGTGPLPAPVAPVEAPAEAPVEAPAPEAEAPPAAP